MTLKRSLVLVPAALTILVVAAAALVWFGARTPIARHVVANRVSDAAGMPATVDSMRLDFLPLPALEIGGLRLAQPPGFGAAPFIEVARVRISIPWRGLFGMTAIDALYIDGATARLVVNREGDSNWARLIPGPARPAAAARGEPPPAPPPAWSLGRFALDRGAIEFEDRSAGSRWRLTAIAVAAENVAPASAFPVELRLAGVFGANTIHYAAKAEAALDLGAGRYQASDLAFSGWAGGEPMPLAGVELTGRMTRAAFESATGIATLIEGRINLAGIPASFSGTVDLDGPKLAADLRLETEVFKPRPPAVAFGRPLPATADPAVWQAAQLSVRGTLRDGELHLDPVSGRVDDTRFEGRIVPAQRLVRARIDRIDVNRYLKPASKGASTRQKKAAVEATLEDTIAELAKLDIDAEIRVVEARVGGARVRDAVIRVEPEAEPEAEP